MKKIVFLIALCFGFLFSQAQKTYPRFGTTPGDDNTGRSLTYAYKTLTDAAGADSVTVNPNASKTVFRIALTDSLFFKSPVVTRSFAADEVVIVASGSSGNKVKFAGTNFVSAGTATLSTGGRAVLTFIFDGAKWVEKSRVVQ